MFKLTPNDLSNIGDAVRKLAVTGIMVETFVHCGNEVRLTWEGPAEPYIVDIKARNTAGLAGTNLRTVPEGGLREGSILAYNKDNHVAPYGLTESPVHRKHQPEYKGPSFAPGEDHS